MEAKHTQGPWGLAPVGDKIVRYAPHHRMESLLTIVNEGGVAFAAVREEADARLISAAPELLESCENVAKDFGKERMDGCEGITDKRQCDKSACIDSDYCERREKLYSMLCNVIAKARG